MSYRHCHIHDELATNGCRTCSAIWVEQIKSEICTIAGRDDAVGLLREKFYELFDAEEEERNAG